MASSYKIPQNVELEDKILGPFTLKQFLYLLAAGLVTFISFSTFYTLSPAAFYLVASFTWLIAGAFVFIRPNEQPFAKFISSFLSFYVRPSQRAWKRMPSLGEIRLEDQQAPPTVTSEAPSEEEIRSKLARLSHIVDARGWSEVDAAETTGRITSNVEAKPKLNIFMAQTEAPQDILEREEEGVGSDRASSDLDRVLGGKSPDRPMRSPQQDIAPKPTGQGA
ncbi:MAG: PrgI family protein [bacterium]|nr:PrgI family protein [bacterium]